MTHPTIALHRAGRARAEIGGELGAARAAGATWVVLTEVGHADNAVLRDALAQARRLGLEPLVELNGEAWADRGLLTELVALGLRAISVSAGAPGASRVMVASADLDHLRVELHVEGTSSELEEQVLSAGASRALVHLHGGGASAAWIAWRAATRAQVELRVHDLQTAPGVPTPASCPPVPIDRNLLQVLRSGARPPALAAGTTLEGSDLPGAIELATGADNLARLLGATGAPVRELPPCLGGRGGAGGSRRCSACVCGGAPEGPFEPALPAPSVPLPDAPSVHVLIPPLPDAVLVHATLPGLAAELAALGARVTLQSAWHQPFNPHGPTPGVHRPLPVDDTAVRAHAERSLGAFVKGLDLSGADAIVAPGWLWGEVALRHKTTPPRARIVLADLHMLEGVERWKKRWLGAGVRSLGSQWWPDERVVVHSCFAAYARLYWYASVPLRQVAWRPYPTSAAHLPAGPDPLCAGHVFAGGSHLRDHATLVAAVSGEGRPIRVVAPRRPARELPSRMRFEGQLPLPDFYEALRTSRYVIVSLHHHVDRAAGLSVVALARAAGRPVLATATPGTLDHVRHGRDGLVVPAGDVPALAAAIARLDADDDLVEHLAEGSLAHGRRQDVSTWAAEILEGSPLPAPDALHEDGPFGPWATR